MFGVNGDVQYLLGRITCSQSIRCGLLLQMESRGLSVGLLVTFVSPAKTAEPIKMPFGGDS